MADTLKSSVLIAALFLLGSWNVERHRTVAAVALFASAAVFAFGLGLHVGKKLLVRDGWGPPRRR